MAGNQTPLVKRSMPKPFFQLFIDSMKSWEKTGVGVESTAYF